MTPDSQLVQKISDSPNFGDRKDHQIDYLILHYTGMQSAGAALERMCDPQAEVSAHYMIEEDGTLHQLVQEKHRAWHAGVSAWGTCPDLNSCSIGIELVNKGHEFGYHPFPDAQMDKLIALAGEIADRYNLPPWHILAHSDIAPARKQDPGELFDWPQLSATGLAFLPPRGVWQMTSIGAPLKRSEIKQLLAHLETYGYRWNKDDPTEQQAVINAFHRHFLPERTDKPADQGSLDAAQWLAQMVG